jgi:ribonuclease E
MRTASSSGLSALRIIEDEAARGRGDRIILRAGREAAIYVLNKKRTELAEIEERYGVTVEIAIDEAFEGARMTVESSGPRPVVKDRPAMAPIIEEEDEPFLEIDEEDEEEAEEEDEPSSRSEREPRRDEQDGETRRRRRRRRGGRGRARRDDENGEPAQIAAQDSDAASDEAVGETDTVAEARPGDDGEERPRSRRGRRGGRGRRGRADAPSEGRDEPAVEIDADASPMVETPTSEEAPTEDAAPKSRRRPRARKNAIAEVSVEAAPEPTAVAVAETPAVTDEEAPAKPKRSRAKKVAAPAPDETPEAPPAKAPAARKKAAPKTAAPAPANNDLAEGEDDSGEPRRGWWQRTFG